MPERKSEGGSDAFADIGGNASPRGGSRTAPNKGRFVYTGPSGRDLVERACSGAAVTHAWQPRASARFLAVPGAVMLACFSTGASCRFDAEVRVPSGPQGPHSLIVLSTAGRGTALLGADTVDLRAR
jgi:hypothetical protein